MAATFTDNSSNITTAAQSTAVTSITVSVPSAVANDDLMFLFVGADGTPGVDLPTGWTEIFRGTHTTITYLCAYRIASSEPSDYTIDITSGSDEMAAIIMRITGHDTVSPIQISAEAEDAFIEASSPLEGIHAAEGVTTTEDDTLVIEWVIVNDDDDGGNEHVPSHASAVATGLTNGYHPSGDGGGQCMLGLATFVQATAGATPEGTSTEAEQWLIDDGSDTGGIENCAIGTIAIQTFSGAPPAAIKSQIVIMT